MGLRRPSGALAVALAGCGGAPDPQAAYAAVVGDPTQRSPSACADTLPPALLGDCRLVVAGRRLDAGEQPEAACPSVPAGVWRDECWFVAAEAAGRADRHGRAAALCQQAGRFAEDCAQHLWQDDAFRVARGQPDLAAVTAGLGRIEARWAGPLSWDPGFPDRLWALGFELAFTGTVLDPARCAEAPAERRGVCEQAALALFSRELAPALERGGVDLCTGPPTAARVRPWLPTADDPRFDAQVAARQAEVCGAARSAHP